MKVEMAKRQLEKVLIQYRNGLITEKERYDLVFDILYQVLYPEQFPVQK